MSLRSALFAFGFIFAGSPSLLLSQWTAIPLHPASGFTDSFVRGISSGQQVGQAHDGSNYHAVRWTGSPGSLIDLNPIGATASRALGSWGSRQVGVATFGFTENAALWTGTAASFLNLHPATGYSSSEAWAIKGDLIVGGVDLSTSGPAYAARWTMTSPTTATFDEMHPGPAYMNSFALGTDGISAVGQATTTGGATHAAHWVLTSEFFTDLNPSGSSYSVARDVEGLVQIGEVNVGSAPHAAMWTGTTASFTDLNPPIAGGSTLYDIDGGYEVGNAFVGGSYKAGIWSSTAASFVNLHAFLPPSTYSSSEARAVWTDGATVYVAGSAFRTEFSRSEAMLWVLPEPASILCLIGGAVLLRTRRVGTHE